jgi:acetyl esterase/lipase
MMLDRSAPIECWDTAYSNSIHIANANEVMAAWPVDAARFRDQARANGRARLDVPYGATARARFDVFQPETAPRGLMVFLHGGCWMGFGKSDWSHLAAGALAHGWAVALPSYDLCPHVRIGAITRQVGAAVEIAGTMVAGPIVLVGHSAGAHLVTRLMSTCSPLTSPTRNRLQHVVGISGIYDLRALLRATRLNQTLQLDEAEARRESPVLLAPLPHVRFTSWVGGDELPEFLRQSALLPKIWSGLGADVELVMQPGRHHFDVIDDLADGASALSRHVFAGGQP